MNKKKISFFIFLPLAALLSACSFGGSSATSVGPSLGGVFFSSDGGVSFRQQSAIPSISGTPGSINALSIKTLAADPSDDKAVYLGTYDQGLYQTYNIADGWNKVSSFPNVTVNNIAVNPKNKCDIYVTFANRLYRSIDCSRTWKQIYMDASQEAVFSAMVMDFYNPNNIYLGNSRGDILKSIDGGTSWRVIKRLDSEIAKLVLHPEDSRQIFVATKNAQIFSFISNTKTNPNNSADIEANFALDNWTDLNAVLKDLEIGVNFIDLIISPSDNSLFLATDKIIARSPDKGISWQKLNLLPSEKDGIIRAVAVSPKNAKQIYYATNLTVARSVDGGATWSNKKLPTSQVTSVILIDQNNPNNIYLGVKDAK